MTPEKQKQYRHRRLMAALRALGFLSVQEAAALMDKDADYTSIKGIGKVLGKVIKEELEKQDAVQ